MLQQRFGVSLLVLVAGLQTTGAFLSKSTVSSASSMSSTPAIAITPPTVTLTYLKSSNDPSDQDTSEDDDAIAKLVGKRNQIKRKKAEDQQQKEAEFAKTLEATVDLDLDKLPAFKNDRPNRVNPRSKDDEKGPKKRGKKGAKAKEGEDAKEESPIVDFMAEYSDENDFHIPNRMGVSTLSWGDTKRNFVGSGKKLTKGMVKAGMFNPGDLQLAYNNLLQGGITLVETSARYGATGRPNKLSAHDILSRCLDEQASDMPEMLLVENMGGSPWTNALGAKAIVNHLQSSCERVGKDTVDLYQVPKSFLFPSTILANGLAAALDSGSCNFIGVQGMTNARALRRLCSKLDDRGVSLTSCSFDYSLTNPSTEAMIDECKDLGVIPLISNPLDNGLASGVFTATNPSGGQVAGALSTKFSFKDLEKLQPLHSVQETIAERVRNRVSRDMRNLQDRFKSRYGPPPTINTDITTTQVALNYVIAKGGVPLPEVKNPKDAEEVLGCLGWTLVDEEVDMLDAALSLCRLK
jgi:aryl-alcohol dehydrogenase-like predicted oxidoreductase